jgi:hypothetical protein
VTGPGKAGNGHRFGRCGRDLEQVLANGEALPAHGLGEARLAAVDPVADGRVGDEAADSLEAAHQPLTCQ